MKWLKQSEIGPPVATRVMLKRPNGVACEAAFCWQDFGSEWVWLDAAGYCVYDRITPESGILETIKWAPLPGQLLPMHCLKPEFKDCLFFWAGVASIVFRFCDGQWESDDGETLADYEPPTGFIPLARDAAELTVLKIPEAGTK